MKIKLDRKNKEPLYQQIVTQVKNQILAGQLPDGYRLPPERRLAENLGVNRTTVLNAYRELKAEGLIGSHVGQGTIVLPIEIKEETLSTADEVQTAAREPVWNHLVSDYALGLGSFDMNDLLELAGRDDIISLATGMAAPDAGLLEVLHRIEHELMTEKNHLALMHSPVEGFASLREAIAKYMCDRGGFCRPDEIMVVSGSQQGIDLTARVFLNPGDLVIVEEPSYFPALQIFKNMNVRIMPVPVDEDGMQTEILEQILKRYTPKLIYTIPSFHNPTGWEMSLARRKHLAGLIRQYKILVLEDDAYGELCYDHEPHPSLKSMDTSDCVIYLSTFSKVIYPGLRIGWMAAHKKLLHYLASARQVSDIHSNCLSQMIVEKFITGDHYVTHLQNTCLEYRQRRDTMLYCLKKYAPESVKWTQPAGGYYIWCQLPEGMHAAYLLRRAVAAGVTFVPGSLFFIDGRPDNCLRLNFTFVTAEVIESGMKILCRVMKEMEAEMKQMVLPDAGMGRNPIA